MASISVYGYNTEMLIPHDSSLNEEAREISQLEGPHRLRTGCTRCPFLELPYELRAQIYNYVLPSTSNVTIEAWYGTEELQSGLRTDRSTVNASDLCMEMAPSLSKLATTIFTSFTSIGCPRAIWSQNVSTYSPKRSHHVISL